MEERSNMQSDYEDFRRESEMEFRRWEEELLEEKKEIQKRQLREEEKYREALQRLDGENWTGQ